MGLLLFFYRSETQEGCPWIHTLRISSATRTRLSPDIHKWTVACMHFCPKESVGRFATWREIFERGQLCIYKTWTLEALHRITAVVGL